MLTYYCCLVDGICTKYWRLICGIVQAIEDRKAPALAEALMKNKEGSLNTGKAEGHRVIAGIYPSS